MITATAESSSPPPPPPSSSTSLLSPEVTTSTDSPPDSEAAQANTTSVTTTTTTTTWWDYVGWGGSSTPDPASDSDPASGGVDPISADETTQTQPPPQPQPSSPASAPELEATPLKNADAKRRAQSVRSAETGSAWYVPWAWYGGTTLVDDGGDGGGEEEDGKTNAERVQDEAMARSSSAPPSSTSPPPAPVSSTTAAGPEPTTAPTPATVQEKNPIGESISQNRGGWASFFMTSSASLTTRRITAGEDGGAVRSDENGMEVMDVPDSDGEGGDMGPPQLVVKDERRGGTQTPPRGRTGAVAPPLTISDDVKRETVKASSAKEEAGDEARRRKKRTSLPSSKREPSPAPSTQSAKKGNGSAKGSTTPKSPIPKPKAPNLVLPSWDDTFHTPPRSIIPPQGTKEGLVGRVGRWLLGGGSETGSVGRGKARQASFGGGGRRGSGGEGDEEAWGRALPRAFDVLETRASSSSAGLGMGTMKKQLSGVGKETDDVLRGCKRVVVIGIHGWFPGKDF